MNLKIFPTLSLNGLIDAPSSKSYSHRAFLAAALGKGISIIKKPLTSGDVAVTIELLQKLGVKMLKESDDIYVVVSDENSFQSQKEVLDCKNSGTTIRFLSVLSLLIDGGLSLTGVFLKKNRPILPLLEALKDIGAVYHLEGDKISVKRVNRHCKTLHISGNISSQFLSALLMVCPILHCENTCFITINTTTPLVSYPYIQITKDILNSFGIEIQETINQNNTANYLISCDQNYRPQVYEIPGDFSSIAFIIAASVLTPEDSNVKIRNLNFQKPQGDRKIITILKKMGAEIYINENQNELTIKGNIKKYPLHGIKIDCTDIPDLFPILSIIGACAKGKTVLYNASHLRYKESDRIAIVSRELQKLGVKVKEEHDKLTIYYSETLNGSKINHENDHRIAMSFTIAALRANSTSQINNIEIINDSYPDFLSHLKKLGASIEFNEV
jgi:3-phosphoshikimate 1-carboxyvinyltransferase